jgi:type IV pilus assembly protein PilB
MTENAADTPTRPRDRRRQLGEMLLRRGLLAEQQLQEALARQKAEKGGRLGRLLVEMGLVSEVQICEVLAEQLHIPAADLVAVDVPPDVLALLPRELAVRDQALPWFVEDQDLYLIMADPTNVVVANEIAVRTGLHIKAVVAPESEVAAAIERFYATEESSLAQFENIDLAAHLSIVGDSEAEGLTDEDVAKAAHEAPVVKLVNAVLTDAVQSGASDIHIEPQQKGVTLRYRVDGMLRQVMTMPHRVQSRIVARIKIMSHMDIAERRKPQDGRTRAVIGPRSYDLRVSSLPTADGEKIVIRILAQDRACVSLDDLGFEPDVLTSLREILHRPQGILLVTGPAGSGKTSTLYASLNEIKGETINIITIEDPVEYRLSGINQVAVSERGGLTFAAGLRSILRQDPDAIMVGEIRDQETAEVAFQAAQTGHLVLSALHTNDAPSAASRLVEFGIPAYLVASSVIGILAQRLVRRLCDCKLVRADGCSAPTGCTACRFSGYRGRTAVYELLRLTPRVRSVLIARGSDDALRAAALATGMRTLHADGLRKVARGVITPEDLARAVPADDSHFEGAPEDGPAPTVSPTLSPQAYEPRRPRLLVVDDDNAFRDALAEMLTEEQYEVVTAASGEDALPLIYRQPPDLVLTDLHMPRMDGLELLQRLRGDLSTCQIPVLFLTVFGDAEEQALDEGADDYVTKPIERGRLLSRIRRSLLRAHLRRGGA